MFCSVGDYNTNNYGESFTKANNYYEVTRMYVPFSISFKVHAHLITKVLHYGMPAVLIHQMDDSLV